MSAITLEEIKAMQTQLAEKIATFEQQSGESSIALCETTITLKSGEIYAGLIIDKEGKPSHHLILIPGEAESINWEGAKAWAKGNGGELPSRREQALLYANLKDQFKPEWYWSSQEHESDSGYAWSQDFISGSQGSRHKDYELRARAVRRLVIE